ncbi:TetR/AcrR family transcriptional regulator [Brachybacterium sp. YJGR34]|uniref:TetR/AcrR family transcriptional regulator n=1 Tax=Brachybacterium sp. YJGR34 TaxID=2059911 RepID=UPI000E0A84B1|nr:TetR family transcriptional regulator [Brachybacterium sp. YJGR34]
MEDATTDPIVEAAIGRFARDGFGASLRAIAKDAHVSAALLVKRFGTKDGLRAACDDEVRRAIRRTKAESIDAAAEHRPMWTLPTHDEHAALTGYLLHSVLDGGAFGRAFLEHMIDDAEGYIADAIERGLARPSRDERARARYMVHAGIGSMLVSMLLSPERERTDLGALLRRVQLDMALPTLELYTQGFFTDETVLRSVEDQLAGAPGGETRPDPPSAAATDS